MAFKFTRQFDQMDCGPACIRMIASAYGKDYPLSYLRSLAHLTREGVSVAGIRDALKVIGAESKSFAMTLEQLHDLCPMPAILYWEQNHFVVIYKVKQNRITGKWTYYIANPAFGKCSMNEKEFSLHWINEKRGTGIAIAIEPTNSFYEKEPVKQKHSFVLFAKKYVKPFKWQLIQSGLAMLLGLILSLITPFLTQAMVDKGIELHDKNFIISILLAQLFIFVGSFTMNIISSRVSLYLSTRININIVGDYLFKLLKLPMTFFDTKSVGDYQQRIEDHNRLQNFVTYNSLETFFSLVSVPFFLFVIGWYNSWILLAYLLFTLIGTAWIIWFFKKRKAIDYENFRIHSKNENKQYELMSGIVDIKLNGFANYKLNEWRNLQEKQYAISRKSLKLNQRQNVGFACIGQLRNILITCWIAMEVVNGNLTLGMMMSIATIIGQLNSPLSQLINFLQQFQDAKISLERSEEVHLCPNEDDSSLQKKPDIHARDIELRHITFSYAGNIGQPALHDVSFTIPQFKMTAIVGESGSGKTTLMKLLLKCYEPTQGDVFVNGVNLKDIEAAAWRKQIGIVMQDNFIFSDTIFRNIILGTTDKDFKDYWFKRCLEWACLEKYIGNLPLGIHTKIGSEGIGLSGGERQRILIARAMYKDPEYFMLDEATSALDAETESKIVENFQNLSSERTRIVIAHRLSTVKNADQIIVLHKGEVVEKGTHNELVKIHGYYYRLVENQLELAP